MNKISVYLLLLFLATSLHGQDVLTTKSGQKIIVAADGTWQNAPMQKAANINTDSTDTVENVFEMPTESKIMMSRAQSQEAASLKSILQAEEIKSLVALTLSNREIENLQIQKKSAAPAELPSIVAKLNKKQVAAKDQKKSYDKAANHLRKLKKLTSEGSNNKLDKKLAAIREDVNKDFAIVTKVKAPAAAATAPIAPKTVGPQPYPTTFKLADSRHKISESPCEVTFDGKDPVTGKNKKEVKEGLLFTFTQDKLKPYFKSDDFLKCESTMTKVGKSYYLTLNIRIKSKDAYRTYGSLPAKEELKIEFIDGTKIYGTNIIQSNGEIEAYSGNTLYTGIFQLDKDEVKQLEKKLVDAVGILWSTGYEQYEVYNVDFLMQQTKCLNN